MELDHLRDLIANRHNGVKRRHRVLEDHGYLFAADVPHFLRREGEQVPPFKSNAAGYNLSRRIRNQAQNAQGRRGFSRPRLSYQAQGLPFLDLQINSVDSLYNAFSGFVLNDQVVDLQNIIRTHSNPSLNLSAADR